MVEIKGKSICNSIAMGKLYFYSRFEHSTEAVQINDWETEIKRFKDAVNIAKQELLELYEKALADAGEESAEIFQIHSLMLDDGDFCESIEQIIQGKRVNAEYAVNQTAVQFSETFECMDDEYMKSRSADVKDIAKRVINILCGEKEERVSFVEPCIIVADDLAPSETIRFEKDKLLGFVTFKGSQTSHTAILARTMNVPAIINTGDIDPCYNGQIAILDGFNGKIYINPDEEKIAEYICHKENEDKNAKILEKLKGEASETKSGKKIMLYANIGSPDDIPEVLKNDAEGIGLFRSEFIYMERESFPSEEEQFLKYKSVLEKMGKKRTIIRTMDIGADKKIDYLNIPHEENPALGYRGIRICLTRTDIFKTQLRALLRASAYGKLAIMFPLIISLDEVRKIKDILQEIKKDLSQEGVKFSDDVEIGIMIETPAAALISETLAPEVDFFSIGTNDLTQYTLAIDRQNYMLDEFYNPHHIAILKLIKLTIENAHKNGKWVGVCGELGADIEMTETLINMGIDELSVSPSRVLEIRKKIRSLQ